MSLATHCIAVMAGGHDSWYITCTANFLAVQVMSVVDALTLQVH